jgi:predicted branched-subunit amino acid permease
MSQTAVHPKPGTARPVAGAARPEMTAGVTAVARRADVLAGIRAMLPWLIGLVPFGLMVGMTAAANGLTPWFGLATGLTIYSGSAQVTAIELVGDGAAAGVVVASVLAINVRLIIYGSAMAPRWRGTKRWFRVLAAYLLVDPSYAEGDRRYRTRPDGGHRFYLGAAITLWVAWQLAILVGAGMGGVVPSSTRLEHVVPLFLLAKLVTAVRTRAGLAAAIAGAIGGLLATGLPMRSGLLVAIAAGVGAGVVVQSRPS